MKQLGRVMHDSVMNYVLWGSRITFERVYWPLRVPFIIFIIYYYR